MDPYLKLLKLDKKKFEQFYLKSVSNKTEQHKLLENILTKTNKSYTKIIDIAGGSGSTLFHLLNLYPHSKGTLVDFNDNALDLASKIFRKRSNVTLLNDNIYTLKKIKSNSFDLVICWQTLSWLDNPKDAILQLIRIAKPGALIIASSLFNFNHDVDLYTKVFDKTIVGNNKSIYSYNYNTFSPSTIIKWVGKAKKIKIEPFNISIDLDYGGKGIGTYTKELKNGKRLQFSAGMLLNWGILTIQK